MIGRIVRPADFERALAAPPCSRSAHFAVHHVGGAPSLGRPTRPKMPSGPVVPPLSPELSTGVIAPGIPLVDESSIPAPGTPPPGRWLGLVVPKRHAKRAVTRNLIKRQLRAAMARHGNSLPPGLWVVRLRQGFDRQVFASPASPLLQEAARTEIEQLFHRAATARRPGAS